VPPSELAKLTRKLQDCAEEEIPELKERTAAKARHGSPCFFLRCPKFILKPQITSCAGREGSDFRSCTAENLLVTPLAVGHNVQQSAPSVLT
jgi:hypothetical protein